MDQHALGNLRDRAAADDPCYQRRASLHVPVEGLKAAALPALERACSSCNCRLYSALEGSGSLVLAGDPQDLGLLRNLLLTEEGLRFVREAVEERLGLAAAPDGLPQLTEELQRTTEVAPETEVPEGTTLRVTREFQFDAAHNLPRYDGKCERLHGHTFRLRVTVDAPLDTWSGMSFDFHDLKKIVKARVVDVLDHSYINEQIPNPSAEHIAIWAWDRLSDLPLHEISVWETPTCCVTYSGPPGS